MSDSGRRPEPRPLRIARRALSTRAGSKLPVDQSIARAAKWTARAERKRAVTIGGGPPLNDRVAICDAGLAVVSARGLATHRGARRPQTNRGRPSIPGAIGVATVSIAVAAAA